MKKRGSVWLITLFAVLQSCINDPVEVDTGKLKTFLETEDLQLQKEAGINTFSGKSSPITIELTAVNPKILNLPNYYPDFAGSMAALVLYDSMDEKQRQKYDNIVIKIKSTKKNQEVSYKYNYSLEAIKKLTEAVKTADKFFGSIDTNFDYAYSLLGEEITNKSSPDTLKALISHSFNGGKAVSSNKLLGFIIGENKIGVIENIYSDSTYTTYAITFYLRNQDKIIGINPYTRE